MVIYAKDIQRITRRSERYAYKVQAAIRKKLGKEKHQLITITEFCAYLGLPEEEVRNLLH
jgi:DNA-directed RNA polymerase specialized sigma subunit